MPAGNLRHHPIGRSTTLRCCGEVVQVVEEAVEYLKETSDLGLYLIRLDVSLIRDVVFFDVSFGNAPGMKSQLELAVLMVDNHNRANVVYYRSRSCFIVARSIMAAEDHVLV